MKSKPFQILSLDGGGIKGLFSAAILANIEKDLNVKIIDHFDLIVGTSTGGIIALGLGLGMKPEEIVQFYISEGPNIFSPNPLLKIKQLLSNKYNSFPLETATKKFFQDKLLSDSIKRLVIPSYNLGDDDIYLFKTSHNERLTRDYKVPMWKIAMATSAAPTYFPAFKELDDHRLIDGGVWANNPSMVGIIEAVSLLNVDIKSIKMLSIGTTEPLKIRRKSLNHGGFFQWALSVTDVILRSQSRGISTQSQHLLGKDNYFRIEPPVPDGLFDLDKLRLPELLSKAAHISRQCSPEIKKHFIQHIASEFIPCQPKR